MANIPFREFLDRAKAAVGLFTGTRPIAANGQQMLGGVFAGGTGPMPERGTKELLDAYSTMPWLRAVAGKIGHSVAETQWQLFAPKNKRRNRLVQRATGRTREILLKALLDSGDLTPIESHPMIDALSRPNPLLVGTSTVGVTQVHLDLIGESFWLKDRDALGTPVQFWPVPPHWIKETPIPGRPVYRVSFSGWQGDIPETEILWFQHPNPSNPYGRGSGIARALADELETDEYAARHARMTFLNRARPDIIVWPEETKTQAGEITEANAQRLAERWRSEHQGFWRAALPFFATRKLGVQELSQSFKELELTALREFERDTIRQVFGVPPEMLGIVEPGASRATIETGEYIYEKHVVQGRREFLRTVFQERLAPEYDERLVVGFVSTVGADKAEQAAAREKAPWSLTTDEWRAAQGLPPMEDEEAGKAHAIPTGTRIVTDILAEPPPPASFGLPPTAGGPPPPAMNQRGKAVADDWADSLVTLREAGDGEATLALAKALADDAEDLPELTRRVGRREPAVRREYAAQLDALRLATPVEAIEAALGMTPDVAAAAALASVPVVAWGESLRGVAREIARAAYLLGARVGAEVSGVPVRRDATDEVWNRVNPQALAWAEAHAGELVADVTQATVDAIRASVVEALAQGWSARKAARVIRESVGLTVRGAAAVARFAARLTEQDVPEATIGVRVARYAEAQRRLRALTIARTELATAASEGQHRLWVAAVDGGLLDRDRMVRVWIAAVDERLEELCEALDGETAPLDGPFSDGTFNTPRHVNCRCAIGLQRAEAAARRVPPDPARPLTLSEAVARGMEPLRRLVSGERVH